MQDLGDDNVPRLGRSITNNEGAPSLYHPEVGSRGLVDKSIQAGRDPHTAGIYLASMLAMSSDDKSKQVEKMLNGEISLEYFVSLVERSSGMERWSLWMEISGRMQISQSFSRQEEQMVSAGLIREHAVPGEFPGSGSTARRSGNYFDLAIEHEKKVARSIMRKSLLCHIETQTEDEDFDEP
eukprot:2436859-Rhodomonas_salina.1